MKLWARSLVWLPVLVVGFTSCGDSNQKKVVAGGAGEGGEGGASEPAAGGSEATPGGAGGEPPATAGAGGASEGGTAAALGGAGGQAELSCQQATPGGAGDSADPYYGAEWKDFAAGACRTCPAAELFCEDLVLDPPASYDPETRLLTLHVAPGKSEIVSASLLYYYFDGEGYPLVTTPAVIDENQLSIPIAPEVGEDIHFLDADLAIQDGCGDEKVIGRQSPGDDWFLLQRVQPAPGGAGGEAPVTYEVRCLND